MTHAFEIGLGGMIYIPGFKKIGTSVQAIARFCLSNLNGSNVGIHGNKL
jgi:hypothetical protein